MTLLSRGQFLGLTERRFTIVELAGVGSVRLQSLSEAERSSYESSAFDQKAELRVSRIELMRRRLIVRCLVDANGNRMFRDDEVGLLDSLDGAVTGRIYDAARKHCGFEESDIEELVKNSSAVHASASRDE